MNNMYVKLNVHSCYTKQVIVLIVKDRRTDGRPDGWTRLVTKIGIRQNFGWGLRKLLLFLNLSLLFRNTAYYNRNIK